MASFIFGYSDVNLRGYEANVTTAALVPFLNNSRQISYWRVLLFSPISFLVSAQVLGVTLSLVNGTTEFMLLNPLDLAQQVSTSAEVAIYFALALLVTSPFDYFSIWTTKRTFVDKGFGDHNMIVLFTIDNILSALPFVCIFGSIFLFSSQLSAFAFGIDPFWGRVAIFVTGLFMVASASLFVVTILQLILLGSGLMIRAMFRLLKLNQPIGLTPASDQPLSFIGFVLGLIFVVVYLV